MAAKKSKAKARRVRPVKDAARVGVFQAGDTVQVKMGDYGNARGVVEACEGDTVALRLGRVEMSFPVDALVRVHRPSRT